VPELSEILVSRIALLELEDERRLAREGRDLLDEKRILLAAEIRRRLAEMRTLREDSRRAEQDAYGALRVALARHGLDELAVYAPLSAKDDRLELERSRLLGLELLRARMLAVAMRESEPPVHPTEEARACAAAFRAWLVPLAALAACSVSLRRLAREFVRTERRARAIENVLLPEVDSALKLIREELEDVEQEEIARVRHRRHRLA